MGKNKQNDRRQGKHDVGSSHEKPGPKTKREGDKVPDGMLQRKISLIEANWKGKISMLIAIVSWPLSVGSP